MDSRIVRINNPDRRVKNGSGHESQHPRCDHYGYSKQGITASYQDKAKRCSHALEVMLKVGPLKVAVIDIIQYLITNIIN